METRVMDMGLTPGTRVMIVKSAPFSGPLEVLVRGSRLVLSRGMAEKIFVEARDGRRLPFSVAVVSDETGTIKVPLWGRRVGMVSVGDIVLVEGVRVEEYLGELNLQVGRGTITVLERGRI